MSSLKNPRLQSGSINEHARETPERKAAREIYPPETRHTADELARIEAIILRATEERTVALNSERDQFQLLFEDAKKRVDRAEERIAELEAALRELRERIKTTQNILADMHREAKKETGRWYRGECADGCQACDALRTLAGTDEALKEGAAQPERRPRMIPVGDDDDAQTRWVESGNYLSAEEAVAGEDSAHVCEAKEVTQPEAGREK